MARPDRTLRLLEKPEEWSMMTGERAAIEGVLSELEPSLSIEIGTYMGGSLAPIAAHSGAVHSFDRHRRPELTADRFPNVTFHIGDSHELLPQVLAELAERGANVDFAFVDGDHTAPGVRRDVEDLLSSPSVGRTVILLHDTLNERVRAGLEQVDYDSFGKVTYLDFDFVAGRIRKEGALKDELWSGLGLLVVGWELGPDDYWPGVYAMPDVYDAFGRVLSEGEQARKPGYGQVLELDHELAVQRDIVRVMERSLSWRLTAPLRTGNEAARRVRRSFKR